VTAVKAFPKTVFIDYKLTEVVRQQGAEENICTEEARTDMRLEKTA
jgi:hypothetical protein